MPTATHRDPRGIITPDAFEVSEALLGKPLASPRRRAVAMLIDLAVIGFVTLVTRSFALVLGVVAAGFFIRAGFKRTPVKGSVFGRAMRGSVGCLGIFIGLLTTVVWATCDSDLGDDAPASTVTTGDAAEAGARAGRSAARMALRVAFQGADDLETAEESAAALIAVGADLGMGPEEIRTTLLEAVPEDAEWADDAEGLFARLLGPVGTDTATDPGDLESEIADYTLVETLDAYREVLEADGDDVGAQMRRIVLQRRLTEMVAADSLDALEDRLEDLENDLDDTSEELAEATAGGVFGWLRSIVEELGFGFGWASLYLTIFLSWWQGQTVGKRVMGIRVVRLDGEPITWWIAFERAGGYAAGFATGLLGFAQVYWDANRQAIHDRIVGTVVVVDGAEPVTDWESAL